MVSAVWTHFSNDKTTDKATCNYCAEVMSSKQGNLANLKRHLDAKHPVQFGSAQDQFTDFCEKIVRFITIENASFRMVESPDFKALFPSSTRLPTRYHLSNVAMPSMVDTLKETIRQVSNLICFLY